MPRSLFLAALGMIGLGVLGLLSTRLFLLSTAAFVVVGITSMLSGIGLLLRRRWARSLASVLVFFGYLTAGTVLLSAVTPFGRGGTHLWPVFGLTFLGVAVLTAIYGSLWNRSVSIYLNENNASDPKK
jgi:hypothetical protein